MEPIALLLRASVASRWAARGVVSQLPGAVLSAGLTLSMSDGERLAARACAVGAQRSSALTLSVSMTDDDDLRLNTLHRFAKHSANLVLEEHGHCEVPAGCGGVIFSWRNPAVATAVLLYVGSPGRTHVFVDGVEARSSRVELAFGRRVLAFHITPIDERARVFAAAARHDPGPQPGQVLGPAVRSALTCADGSWRACISEPEPQALTSADFDDRHWMALPAVDTLARVGPEHLWGYDQAVDLGAVALRLPAAESLWVRTCVTVTHWHAEEQL